jgi:hypothetical protein
MVAMPGMDLEELVIPFAQGFLVGKLAVDPIGLFSDGVNIGGLLDSRAWAS